MSIQPITDKEKELIYKNVVAACRDISKLNKRGYGFLYLASGFIAHFNLDGFREAFGNGDALRRAILANQDNNQWRNFRIGEQNAEYYFSKRDVYNRICAALARA
jgi:hypothetical protein